MYNDGTLRFNVNVEFSKYSCRYGWGKELRNIKIIFNCKVVEEF